MLTLDLEQFEGYGEDEFKEFLSAQEGSEYELILRKRLYTLFF